MSLQARMAGTATTAVSAVATNRRNQANALEHIGPVIVQHTAQLTQQSSRALSTLTGPIQRTLTNISVTNAIPAVVQDTAQLSQTLTTVASEENSFPLVATLATTAVVGTVIALCSYISRTWQQPQVDTVERRRTMADNTPIDSLDDESDCESTDKNKLYMAEASEESDKGRWVFEPLLSDSEDEKDDEPSEED